MTDPVASFIARWQGVTASELATAQSFVIGLCRLLDLPEPHATVAQDYMFERPVTFRHGDGGASTGRIDCYRRGCFVLEAKKIKVGAGGTAYKNFDDALLRARSQAEGYARALPADEGRPPFLIVVDVGNVVELYAEFSRTGATYVPYPDPRSHRIRLADLRDKDIRDRLRNIWLDPLALDPTRQSAKVTRAIAAHLAEVARSLEQAGHAPETVAGFLTRCLFSMFAEDVQLIPKGSFTELLKADAPIKDYRNGRDLTDKSRGVLLIDLFGHDADEVRRRWPATYQRVLTTVKPERDCKAHTPDGVGYARLWWLHGKPRQELRKMLAGLPRYIATVETAKHRVFQFLDAAIAPDNMLICGWFSGVRNMKRTSAPCCKRY